MTVMLSLGSNLGDRAAHIERALSLLETSGVALLRVSPAFESPAQLPSDAPSEWNRPYINIAAECATQHSPGELLVQLKSIERLLGRDDSRRWSPRPIDIDILLYKNKKIATQALTVPHALLTEREFVLAPLAAICPGRVLPGAGRKTVLQAYRELKNPIPLWMGILNVTPDSFSDGGKNEHWNQIEPVIEQMVGAGVGIIDIGAESTRPGAAPLSADAERTRLEPILERVIAKFEGVLLRPWISVDTYHAEVAQFAIASGADMINDVGGLSDPAMIELAAASDVDWVAMHQLSIPADPNVTLSTDRSAVEHVDEWIMKQLNVWSDAGLDLSRILIDPGIGFGKTSLQSLQLLRGINHFVRDNLRVLVGHSRKSFMNSIGGNELHDRDLLTIGASLELSRRGVDVIRVHNVGDHVAAYRGFAHAHGAA
jgi:2-amino-4-hydroxy-6-hydroxymethyldihydropteridine diphosphokinase/dihydropteroate synthase